MRESEWRLPNKQGFRVTKALLAEKPKDARIKSGKYMKTKSGNGENENGEKNV